MALADCEYMLVVRRYAPFSTFGGGFEGDKRPGPSTSGNDTARTAQVVIFNRTPAVRDHFGHSSGTSHWWAFGLNQYHPLKLYAAVSSEVVTNVTRSDYLSFTATSSGSNPMVPGAPAIDTIVDFTAWFCLSRGIIFRGSVRGNDFPNAEVFVWDSSAQRKGVLLFDFRTAGWGLTGPMTKLWGAGARTGLGSFERAVQIQDDGQFVSASSACAITRGK